MSRVRSVPVRVIIVEDDHLQAEAFASAVRRAFRLAEIITIHTESEFRTRFESLRANPPSLFVLDVILRWSNPSEELGNPPEEATVDGIYRGGMRCLRMILATPEIQDVPVIVYSVVAHEAIEERRVVLPAHVVVLDKSSNDNLLVRAVRSLITAQMDASPLTQDRAVDSSPLDMLELKPNFFGVGVNFNEVLRRAGEAIARHKRRNTNTS